MRHYLFGIFFFFMLILPFSTQVEAQEVSTASNTPTIVQSEEETMDPPEVTGIMSEEEKDASSTEQMPVNAEPVVLNNEASVQADSEQNPETYLTCQSKLVEASKISVDSSLQGNVEYRVHVQTYGWQSPKVNGQTAGTSGQSKRLESIRISVKDTQLSGHIQYRTHIQSYGWETSWKQDGQISGTSGQSKRLEAIQIRLTDQLADLYSIYYRVHCQNYGWLGWAKDGEYAGSQGFSKRLEAIEIQLVKKGEKAPAQDKTAFVCPYIKYTAHVQSYGWQSKKIDGQTAGTSGQSKRIEAITLQLMHPAWSGHIMYRTHIQSIGWQNWQKDGQVAGTVGKGLRMEGIQIQLTGDITQSFDVYYRVHIQDYGWMDWTSNGMVSGSEGMSKRIEGIEVQLVAKNHPKTSVNTVSYLNHEVGYHGNTTVTGWNKMNGNQYYFDTNGKLLKNQAIGNRYVNARGKEITDPLEKKIASILSSTGWNLRKGYQWIISHIQYQTMVANAAKGSNWYAAYGYNNRKGNCYVYAALMYKMGKLLGYDIHQVAGTLAIGNNHSWTEVVINKKVYIIDPDMEYELHRNGYMLRYGAPGTLKIASHYRMN